MFGKISRVFATILLFLAMKPVFAHESLDHFLGYTHESIHSHELIWILLMIIAVFFVFTLIKIKKDRNKYF
jgi:hypothetical protein